MAPAQNAIRRKINAKLSRVIIISHIVTADAVADVSNTVAYAGAPNANALLTCA